MYPALTVLRALEADKVPLTVLWVGRKGGMEADLVKRAGIQFKAILAAGVHNVGWRALPGNIQRLVRGFFSSLNIIKQFKPDVFLFTGGYVAVPMALASRVKRNTSGKKFPSLLFTPDIEPGIAIKLLSYLSSRVAVPVEESRAYFSHRRNNRISVTGYPTRLEYSKWDHESGRKALRLLRNIPILLIFGGSRGARSINRALLKILPALLDRFQIIHITGQFDWKEVQTRLKNLKTHPNWNHYHVFPYLHEEMGAALACADLVVSRAGASCLGEYPFFGLPAILVPLPQTWRYQYVNAEYLQKHNAAILLEDHEMETRMPTLIEELFNNPERLENMRQNMKKLSHPQAPRQIACLVRELGGQDETCRHKTEQRERAL